jgi:hypothetical protein
VIIDQFGDFWQIFGKWIKLEKTMNNVLASLNLRFIVFIELSPLSSNLLILMLLKEVVTLLKVRRILAIERWNEIAVLNRSV